MNWLHLLLLLQAATALAASTSSSSSSSSSSSLDSCLSSHKITRISKSSGSSESWTSIINPFNQRLPYTPASVALPNTVEQVSAAVKCATKYGYKVQARSGGHSYASYGLGGKNGSLVIDTRKFTSIDLDTATNIATVGSGNRLGNIALAIHSQGKRALPHGLCPGVGLGGHATNGGFGYTSRMWGITLDTIVGMTVVIADGRILDVTKASQPDLFWAIRGAGPSFGIVTHFRFATHPAPTNGVHFTYNFTSLIGNAPEQAKVFRAAQSYVSTTAPANMALRMLQGFGMYLSTGVFWGSRAEFNATVAPLLAAWPVEPDTVTVSEADWITSLEIFNQGDDIAQPANYTQHDTFFTKSVVSPVEFTTASLESFFAFINTAVPPEPVVHWSLFDLYGGAHSVLTNNFTLADAAYAGRDTLWTVQLYSHTPNAEPYPLAGIDFMGEVSKSLTEEMRGVEFGAYPNYVDPSYGASEAHELYYGSQYERLAKLKRKWDGKGVFWNPQAIGVE